MCTVTKCNNPPGLFLRQWRTKMSTYRSLSPANPSSLQKILQSNYAFPGQEIIYRGLREEDQPDRKFKVPLETWTCELFGRWKKKTPSTSSLSLGGRSSRRAVPAIWRSVPSWVNPRWQGLPPEVSSAQGANQSQPFPPSSRPPPRLLSPHFTGLRPMGGEGGGEGVCKTLP